MIEPPSISTAPAFEARHSSLLWLALVLYLAALVAGVVSPGEWLVGAGSRVAWILLWAACLIHLGVHLLRGMLILSPDGVLTKRVWRTHQVNLHDLVALHTRGDRPWSRVLPATIGFEDRKGGRVDVAFRTGWQPPRLVWASLAEVIERAGLPLPGITAGQLEVAVHRRLGVTQANRRALEAAREALRRGAAMPHRTRGGLHATLWSLMAAALPALFVWAAGEGMVPPEDARQWQLFFAGVTLLVVLLGTLVPTRSLDLTADAILTERGPGRRRDVDLGRLVEVQLVPDRPYLQRTTHGAAPNGPRVPSLHLRDRDVRQLRISLGAQWQESAPILRHVLAAAEEHGVDLSPHARHELEFRVGVIPGPEWVT